MNRSAVDATMDRGPASERFVSLTEPLDVSRFIVEYLRARGCAIDERNRRVVMNAINTYTGRAPILRLELRAYLDRVIPWQ